MPVRDIEIEKKLFKKKSPKICSEILEKKQILGEWSEKLPVSYLVPVVRYVLVHVQNALGTPILTMTMTILLLVY